MADTGPGESVPPLPRPPADTQWADVVTQWWASRRAGHRKVTPSVSSALRLGCALVVVALIAGRYVLRPAPGLRPEDVLPVIAPTPFVPTPTVGVVIVHVAGAVHDPGVHRLKGPARVVDVIAQAGGPTGAADLDRLNLAASVSDGARLYVPVVGEDPPQALNGAGPVGSTGQATGPLDLNRATAEQLQTLPGVGPATAAAITAFRDEHGDFASVDELDDVAGIGPAKLDRIRPLVVAG